MWSDFAGYFAVREFLLLGLWVNFVQQKIQLKETKNNYVSNSFKTSLTFDALSIARKWILFNSSR